jgi:hypothetical protein
LGSYFRKKPPIRWFYITHRSFAFHQLPILHRCKSTATWSTLSVRATWTETTSWISFVTNRKHWTANSRSYVPAPFIALNNNKVDLHKKALPPKNLRTIFK